MLLSHLMKIFAYLGIQADSCVVVDSELLLACIITFDCHCPPIQKLCFPQIIVFLNQIGWIRLLSSPSPAESPWQIIPSPKRENGHRWIDSRPLRNPFYVVHNTTDSTIPTCYNEKDVRYLNKQLEFYELTNIYFRVLSPRLRSPAKGSKVGKRPWWNHCQSVLLTSYL